MRRFLDVQHVPVVALPRLIVIAQDTGSIGDEGEPVFETVTRATHGSRDAPDHKFNERLAIEDMPLTQQQFSLCVGDHNNTGA
jgi:hypothetical protein